MILEANVLPKEIKPMVQAERYTASELGGVITLTPVVFIEKQEGEVLIPKRERRPRIKTTAERLEGYTGDYEFTEWDTGPPVGEEIF